MESWRTEGAETCRDVADRTYPCLVRIAEENDGKTVAVVSHGVAIRCLLSRCLGISLSDVKSLPICTNTGVTRLLYENGVFTADYINDNSHLAELDTPLWTRTPDLRGESFDPASDPDCYKACYRDAWCAAHGSDAGYKPMPYYLSALDHYEYDPGAVLRIFDGDTLAGLIDLDPVRGAHAGIGWISLLYLRPEYRHMGCGVQLLGRAISFYTALGRKCLRLHVAEDNTDALKFYGRWGFTELSRENTGRSTLLLMEKKLGGQRDV